jgi:hypothetical protein
MSALWPEPWIIETAFWLVALSGLCQCVNIYLKLRRLDERKPWHEYDQ